MLSSLLLAPLAAGAVAVGATGGGRAATASAGVAAANVRTAHLRSIHYAVRVTLLKQHVPMTLRITGGSSRDDIAVHLKLDDLRLANGQRLSGASGTVLMSTPFLYESSPGGVAVYGTIRWLRLDVSQAAPRAQVLSNVRALTPSPLLRIVAETKLLPTGRPGGFVGSVPYADPVVATALRPFTGGLQFRNLRLFVHVRDGRVDSLRLTGRTPDRSTRLALHARLFGFDAPVRVVPPRPGTFLDKTLLQLQS